MAYRVKVVIVATDAGVLFTCSDLRPEWKEQHPNTGQPHEDTPATEAKRSNRETGTCFKEIFSVLGKTAICF